MVGPKEETELPGLCGRRSPMMRVTIVTALLYVAYHVVSPAQAASLLGSGFGDNGNDVFLAMAIAVVAMPILQRIFR